MSEMFDRAFDAVLGLCDHDILVAEGIVKRVIAALREPTPEILAVRGTVRLPDRLDDAALWRMQIDVILKE